MRSRLVVLGSCGPWPEPGRACSGLLLETADTRVVLDLGYATLPRLLLALDSLTAAEVDAVVVTHRHADHAIDLHGLFRARYFSGVDQRLPLLAPVGVLEQIEAFEEDDDGAVRKLFDWHLLPGPERTVGPWQVTSWALPHYVPNAGVRLSMPGLTVAYTGDTGPDPALEELGRDVDLFIMTVNAGARRPQRSSSVSGPAHLHLTAEEAGRAAQAAGARSLLLTHFTPGQDRESCREAALDSFDGSVLIADEGLVIPLP